ncbi:DUF4145 domain-containing protein [Mesobacillus maritimus]|uniref:DUF4145 domain-containing protein n=1 Tax=Mesobacillus maritimus TaxID=1643336 RepID=UPI00203CBD0B|nr:DUF4145 domain-containing protein [Mesobacillus maritimus]MCM3584560.1 DUF4145 domain-containing protein [Mesobacillus maritimus]
MKETVYFYQFLEPLSRELSMLAKELETSIFSSPRTMLTHTRVFIETILQKVMEQERLPVEPQMGLKDRLDLLNDRGYLTPEIRDALHLVRINGNKAAHDVRRFRYSEALLSWEALYEIVKWYVEVYGPIEVQVPDYQDPQPQKKQSFDMTELEVRLKGLEELLRNPPQSPLEPDAKKEVAVSIEVPFQETEMPGFTTIRTLMYKNLKLEIPYFLRDSFLLPQRFAKSELFLIRLGAEQQARIMSELPKNLEGLHLHVKRYSDKNTEIFFHELKTFIEEEKVRRKLTLERPGELFFFYKDQHLVVTEHLAKVRLASAEFIGIPSLLRQLNEDQIETVGQLPQELVILAKYENVGVGTVEKLFEQIKLKADTNQVMNEDDEEEGKVESRKSYKKWESLFVHVTHGNTKTVIRGESVPSLWKEALQWIEAQKLPLASFVHDGITLGATDIGNRYAIALQPVHKNQKPFSQMHIYESSLTEQTYYLETKINPKSGLETLRKIFTMLGVDVEIPLLEQSDQ